MRATFGDFVIDFDKRELTRDGERCHLSTKAFLLLDVLVRNAPRALRKQELYDGIWGNTFVEDANLPNLISEIRSALGAQRSRSRFIRTIHGYGYAFSADVAMEATERRRLASASDRIWSIQWGRQKFLLSEGENVIGRGEDTDIVIDSVAVSRRHARIEIDGATAMIEDLASKNGTFVAGERITTPVPLRDGDDIRLGRVLLRFRGTARGASTLTDSTR